MQVIACPRCWGTRAEPQAVTTVTRRCARCDGWGWVLNYQGILPG
jgi:hypothetical protein